MADSLVDLVTAGIITDPLTVGLQTMIREEEPLIDRMPWVSLPQGKDAYLWYREIGLGTAAWRAVNSSWESDHATWTQRRAGLSILGGEVEVDTFIKNTMGGAIGDIKGQLFSAKMRAVKLEWLEAFFEGDSGVDPNSMDGLRARLGGTGADFPVGGSTVTDATALTLEKLDQVIDYIRGSAPDAIMMNQFLRRKVNALRRLAGQAQEMVDANFGKQIPSYVGIPMLVIQRENDMSSVLGFDEDPGDGGDDAASIYLAKFGREDVFSILGHGGAWQVHDMGEQQASPRHLGRVELYTNVVIKHPRSAARISRIGQV